MTTFANMRRVQSSNLEGYGYHAGARELCLVFKGGATHVYEGVPQETVDAFEKAESKGSHFHAHIRHKFNSRKVETT